MRQQHRPRIGFKVVANKAGTRLYAKVLVTDAGNGRGTYLYDAGAIRTLTATDKLTPEGIAAAGLAIGHCLNCGEKLEDPISQFVGLGTSCGPKILGKDAYAAAKKAAKADADWKRRQALPEDHPEAIHEDYRHFATEAEAMTATEADILAHFGIR